MRLTTILVFILLVSCDKPSIRGSWYTDLKNGDGVYDTISNYCEIYVNDTTLFYQEELMGTTYDQEYYIEDDSIFKCFGTGDSCKFIPMYKIVKIGVDTIWLTVNEKFAKGNSETLWVRFPKDELGYYDFTWTDENRDSLRERGTYDYDRRRAKYYSIKYNRPDYYDSMVKAGTWNWTMNEVKAWEESNKPKKENIRVTAPTEFPDSLRKLFGDTTKTK